MKRALKAGCRSNWASEIELAAGSGAGKRDAVRRPDAVSPSSPSTSSAIFASSATAALALPGVQPPHQLPRRRRRHDLFHGARLRSSLVRAQFVQVHQMVAAHRHHLGQRDQQFAAGPTTPSLLEGTDAVDGAFQTRDQVGAGGKFSGQQQAGVTGQRVVIGSDLDLAGAWATMHLTGVLPTWTNGVSATPFSNTDGTRLSRPITLPSVAYSHFQVRWSSMTRRLATAW